MDQNSKINDETNREEHQDIDYLESSSTPATTYLAGKDVETPSRPTWPVQLVAMFTLLSGVVAAIQPLATRLAEHPRLFTVVYPFDYYHLSKSIHVVAGLFLIYLSINLFKRKHNAYLAAIALASLSAGLHAGKLGIERIAYIEDPDLNNFIPFLTVIIPVSAVVLLFIYRDEFKVRSERYSIKTGFSHLVLSVWILIAYGTVGFFLLDKYDFGVNFQLTDALHRTLQEVFLIGNSDLVAQSHFAKWFLDSLHMAGVFTVAYASYSLFRPIQYELSTHPKERERVKALLKQHGKDALDHYKASTDKSYFFLENGNSVVAYTTVLNTAIGLGDPVGPDDELEKVTKAYRDFCHLNDWKMAFLQVKPDNLEKYKQLSLDVLKVGEEAIIDLEKFASKGAKGKNFKSKIKKFEKDGYVLERHAPPHSEDLINSVEKVSDEWLSLPGRRERGFSLGWFNREELASETIFVLKDSQGTILAFVNQVPSYAPGEASIDMMRHKETVPNGTMDFLFAKLLLALKEDGFKTFNLGLAALSGVGDSKEASLEEKAVHEIYERMNRFFSYKGLRRYKDKFDPDWKESFLVYEGGPPGLIKTALAITRAGEIASSEN